MEIPDFKYSLLTLMVTKRDSKNSDKDTAEEHVTVKTKP